MRAYALSLGTSASSLQYQCNACRVDLTDIVRVRCAVCDDVDLCADCFAEGKEVDHHANDHDYRIIVMREISEEGEGEG